MYKISQILLINLSLFILIACDDNYDSLPTLISGTSNLTSMIEDGNPLAFSFKDNGVVILTGNQEYDFKLMTATGQSGDIFESFISSNNPETEFARLIKSSDTMSDQSYFDSIQTVPDSIENWDDLAYISSGNILLVKTKDSKYGKIYFQQVTEIKDRGDGLPLSSATFTWVYESGGSKKF